MSKTAMQELIEKLRKERDIYKTVHIRNTYTAVLAMAVLLLEKEKQQIADAFHSGTWHEIGKAGDEYYTQTFTQ